MTTSKFDKIWTPSLASAADGLLQKSKDVRNCRSCSLVGCFKYLSTAEVKSTDFEGQNIEALDTGKKQIIREDHTNEHRHVREHAIKVIFCNVSDSKTAAYLDPETTNSERRSY